MKDTELFLVNPSKVLMAYIEWLLSAKLNPIIRADKERVVRAVVLQARGPGFGFYRMFLPSVFAFCTVCVDPLLLFRTSASLSNSST